MGKAIKLPIDGDGLLPKPLGDVRIGRYRGSKVHHILSSGLRGSCETYCGAGHAHDMKEDPDLEAPGPVLVCAECIRQYVAWFRDRGLDVDPILADA